MSLTLLASTVVRRLFNGMKSDWATAPSALRGDRPSAQVIPFQAAPEAPSRVMPAGLAETAQIQSFLQQDFGALGRTVALREPHDSARTGALDSLRAQFDNILDGALSSHRERSYQLEQLRVDLRDEDAEAAANPIARKARLALEHNQDRIAELQEQRRLTATDQGWFTAAAVAFDAGFQRGLRESSDILKLLA